MIIDVSKWQGKIDWAKVKSSHSDLKGVYIKATEGIGYIDPFLISNAVEANKEGIQVGFYHFASLNAIDVVTDATNEAKFFYNTVKSLNCELPYVLDIEKNASQIPPKSVLLWIKSFFKELDRLHLDDYVLYSYAPFLNDNLPPDHDLGHYRLWLAAYTDKPKLPKGWSEYFLWQYTSKGAINGITGSVDLNQEGPNFDY
jgi:lysozyme